MPSHPCRASVGHPVWSGTPDGPSCKAQPSSALLRNHTGWVVPVGLSGDSGDPVRAASLLHFLPRLPSLPDGPCRPHGETQASRSVSPHSRAWHPSPRTGRDPPPRPRGPDSQDLPKPPYSSPDIVIDTPSADAVRGNLSFAGELFKTHSTNVLYGFSFWEVKSSESPANTCFYSRKKGRREGGGSGGKDRQTGRRGQCSERPGTKRPPLIAPRLWPRTPLLRAWARHATSPCPGFPIAPLPTGGAPSTPLRPKCRARGSPCLTSGWGSQRHTPPGATGHHG